MKQKNLFKISALFLSAVAWSVPAIAEEHHHEHGENCTHSREEHENEAGHDHEETREHVHKETHEHVHGENCSGNHAHDEDEAHEHGEDEHSDVPAVAGEKHEHAHDETVISVSERARQSLALTTEKVSASPVLSGKSYYGQMMLPPAAVETSALTASGRVRFFVQAGQTVSAGTPLYAVNSPELLEMSADVKDAEAALTRARVELDSLKTRLSRLAEIGVKNSELESETRFKEAEIASLEIAAERSRALLKQATGGAELAEGTLTVPATEDGIVQSIELAEGAWGERGQSALSLIKYSPLEFKGSAFGNDDFTNASAELAVNIAGKTERFTGTLRVSAQIDESSQARTVYFTPDNLPGKLIYPGQVARLDVFKRDAAAGNFVLVPNSAVIKVGVDDVVFVCDSTDPNKFTARKVKTLPSRRGMTPVSDIHAGETVVSKGGYELKYILPADGNAPKRKAAGHFHADGKFHEGEH